MHAGPGKVMALSPGAQNLQFDKSVIASNTSLQHKVNLYRLINVDTSREDANSDGGQVNAIGFKWSDATYMFLGLIILAVVVWFIRRKRTDGAAKQEAVLVEEIGRKAAKIAEEKFLKQTAIQMSCLEQMFITQVPPSHATKNITVYIPSMEEIQKETAADKLTTISL